MLGTALISGFGLGSIYGLIALGFTLTFSVSGTVNFAQGSSVMLGAVLCHTLYVGMHWPFAPAVPLTPASPEGPVAPVNPAPPFPASMVACWMVRPGELIARIP